jgi:hypothetical protein
MIPYLLLVFIWWHIVTYCQSGLWLHYPSIKTAQHMYPCFSSIVGDRALFRCACFIDCANSISRRKNSVPSPYTLRDVKNSSVSEMEDMFLFISRANRNSFFFISV